jgi:4-amino-4-deoxy-L-arabinose transferase-like glycosyltransferase
MMTLTKATAGVEPMSKSTKRIALAIVAFYLLLSGATLTAIIPMPDEAGYANPGYNLVYNGHLGTTVYELRDFLPLSMAKRTYQTAPLYYFVTAAMYKLCGFGVIQVRILSLLFGMMAMISWFWMVRILCSSERAGLLAMLFVAVDYFFMFSASTGRMDMMCVGLGSAALALYLMLRKRSLARAMFWSHVLATLAILTHPVGLLYWLCLVMLIAKLDWRSLSIKPVVAAVIPCIVGVIFLGAYILEDPQAFREQVEGQVRVVKEAFNDPGLSSIGPLRSLQLEWRYRYQGPFGLGSGVPTAQRLKAIILVAYFAAVLILLIRGRRERWAGQEYLLSVMAIISILYLAFASPSKYFYYLAHITVFLSACLAAAVSCRYRSRQARSIMAGVAIVVVGVQVSGGIYRALTRGYERSYLAMIDCIKQHTTPKSVIMGGAELWFSLEHDRYVIADPQFGAFDHRWPDIFVMDEMYTGLHEESRTKAPWKYAHVQALLDKATLIYEDAHYRVYESGKGTVGITGPNETGVDASRAGEMLLRPLR